MTTTVKVIAQQRVTVRPEVTDNVTVVIKAVGPQGPTGSSSGDMTKIVYDPTNVLGDAFAMDNMVEGSLTKVFTSAERTKLAGIQDGATVADTAAEVKIKYESNSNTNEFNDAEKAKLGGLPSNADNTSENETTHADVLVDADIGFTVASFGHNHAGVYEPVFAKNSGFNKALGTTAGTVAEGNHTHTGVYEPADATILKDADIGVKVPAKTHTHTQGDITDLGAFIKAEDVTFENLDANGDVGTGADQVAQGNHTHTRMTVFVEDMDAELAPMGYVPITDGLGEVTWQAQSGATPATPAEIDAGTDIGKVATPYNLKESKKVPHVTPGPAGEVLTSDGTNWISQVSDAVAMAIALG